jgi:hypothetical protein
MLPFPDPPLADGVIRLRAKAPADVDALVAACQDPGERRSPVREGLPEGKYVVFESVSSD